MSETLDQIRERMEQNRTQRAADLAQRLDAADANGGKGRGTLFAGDRVFDSITALEGEVVRAPALSGNDATLIGVRFGNGAVVWRRPGELITRPAPASTNDRGGRR